MMLLLLHLAVIVCDQGTIWNIITNEANILSGLNESYDQAQRQFLFNGTAATLNQLYVMLIEDVIQHSIYVATMVGRSDKLVMNSNRIQGKEHYKGKKCEFCNFTSHTK